MANKKAVLNKLADYFADKGQVMSPAEYKEADDAPMRFMVAKRPFGSWARMQSMMQTTFPDQWAKANKVVATPAPKAAAPKAKAKPAATKKVKAKK
tara:strand:+ start:133 stop:420 length:288 start_codon:yes stop_codon:yes gene_type:complete